MSKIEYKMPYKINNYLPRVFVLLGFLFFLNSCQKTEESRRYEEVVLNAPQPAAASPSFMDDSTPMDPHAGLKDMPMSSPFPIHQLADELTWTVPQGWIEKKGDGLRLVTFISENPDDNVECSIVSMGGEAGGLKANVIRWMGQINLAVPVESQLEEFLSRQEKFNIAENLSAVVIDLTSLQEESFPSVPSMMAAMIATSDGVIFVKMTGNKQSVINNRDAFKELCRSLKLG